MSSRASWGIFLTFLGFFLVTGSREDIWGDAKASYKVAEQVVEFGTVELGYAWPLGADSGRNNRFYAPYGALTSLVHVPGAYAIKKVRELGDRDLTRMWRPLIQHLPSALAGALSCLLFFRLACRVGVRPRVAGITTAILATATLVWPYARDPFSEMLQTACFTGFLGSLVATAEEPSRRRALALGVWAGLLVNAKLIYVVSLAGGGLFLLVALRRKVLRLLPIAILGFAPFFALYAGYAYLRYGSLLEPTIAGNESLFRERILVGLSGLFLSSGKSLFLYSPPLLVGLFGVAALWRRRRAAVVAFLLTAGPLIFLYAHYIFWDGGHAWGPRYLVFLVPAALLPLAVFLDEARGARRVVVTAAFVLFGVYVQILGGAFWRGHWIRMSREVNSAWIGGVARDGTSNNYDDLYGVQWMPHHAPITGHAWLLRHILVRDPWAVAVRDAPWARYVTRELDLKRFYDVVRLDWYPLLWIEEIPARRKLGLGILGVEVLLLLTGGWLWSGGRRFRFPRRAIRGNA